MNPSSPRAPGLRPLLVLSLDGFTPSSLGCYGCSWNRTPAIDRVASRGAVWDRLIATSTSPFEVLRSWIRPAGNPCWPDAFRAWGSVELITDDRLVAEPEMAAAFDRVDLIDEPRQPADGIEETCFGRLIAAAIERHREGVEDWSVLWLHSRFLRECWDAPRELSPEEDWDEEDPAVEQEGDSLPSDARGQAAERVPLVFDPPTPPRLQLSATAHPDLVSAWMRTYACQIRLVDLLLGLLLESLEPVDPVVIVLGTSGFSLGQNGWIGHRCGPLRSCQIRLPMVIGWGNPIRSPHVTSSAQVSELLARLGNSPHLLPAAPWAESDHEFEPSVLTVETDARPSGFNTPPVALTTKRWFYVRNPQQETLFLKPDDTDDANDISRLRQGTVDRLRAMVEGEVESAMKNLAGS